MENHVGWAKRMCQDRYWADTAAVRLAAMAFGMEVIVIKPGVDDIPYASKDGRPKVYIGHYSRHFMALDVCDDSKC